MDRAEQFDVAIVGARCAGAALGKRLADAGLSVALLDAAKLPSDQPCSTHLIQPPGMDQLDALGIGETVRRESPALAAARLAYDAEEARLPYSEPRPAHCLRRERLDGLLQQTAADAGAELRPECRVTGLLREPSGRICGVSLSERGGEPRQLRADLVIGADGRNSTVAKLVGAREYLGYDGPRAAYWAYWQRPAGWSAHELCNFFADKHARVVFPTGGDLLLVPTAPPVARAREWRGAHRLRYLEDIRACTQLAAYLGDAEPVTPVRGILRPRYFFRESAGPGWALIGDAGHHKEFVIGLGISDALRDAAAISSAILVGEENGIRRWWRERDLARIELFFWGKQLGLAEPVNELQRRTAHALAENAQLAARFAEIIDGQRSPRHLLPATRAVAWVVSDLARARAACARPLLRAVRDQAAVLRELRRRRRMAAA
jgi:flavin-dependent dehydrogenase